MKIKLFFFFVFFLYSINSNSTSIRVIDLNILIESNKDLLFLISKIENDQKIHKEKFLEKELILQSKLKDLHVPVIF